MDAHHRLIQGRGMMRLYLAALRKRFGLTQERLSERCLVTPLTVARHETGAAGWNSHTIQAYASGLGVAEYEVFGYDLPPTFDLPAATRSLLKRCAALDERSASEIELIIPDLLSLGSVERGVIVDLIRLHANKPD